VIEPLWGHANFYEDEATFELSMEGATRGQRALYACTWYLSEVNNGGHDQFFSNCTGMVWDDALTGFRLLNAVSYEAILRGATALFPYHQPSKDRIERIGELEAIGLHAFGRLDDQLYALKKQDDIDSVFLEFINRHPDQFFL
jgi:hypothetical protein